ncbi:MAG: hypothetical protein ACYCXG_10615 [Acidiferrobacter sp.]
MIILLIGTKFAKGGAQEGDALTIAVRGFCGGPAAGDRGDGAAPTWVWVAPKPCLLPVGAVAGRGGFGYDGRRDARAGVGDNRFTGWWIPATLRGEAGMFWVMGLTFLVAFGLLGGLVHFSGRVVIRKDPT